MAIHFVQGRRYLAAGDAPFGVPGALIRSAAGAAGFRDVEVFDSGEIPVPADAPMDNVDTIVRGIWGNPDADLEPPTGILWVYDVTGSTPVRVFPAPVAAPIPGVPSPIPAVPTPIPGVPTQLPPGVAPAVPPFNPSGQAKPAPGKDRELTPGWQYAAIGAGAVLLGGLVAYQIARR